MTLAAGLLAHWIACAMVLAAEGPQSVPSAASAVAAEQPLEEVVITGSLIPTANEITAVPSTTITAEDLQNKGYLSLADALQRQVYATGGVGNAQQADYNNGVTPGAQTLSMFGLPPGYVKYLIDGRPMPDYPALYGGSDLITNIGGIPEDLVDHIDVLPGGQSSLYGSDAIAGLVNVLMKKDISEPVVRMHLGGYEHGGGTDRRISAAAGHEFNALNVMGGLAYEKIDPIWGYQRDLTKARYAAGSSPPLAALNWEVNGPYSPGNPLYLLDPSQCGKVSTLYGSSVARQSRAGRGDYCGTFNAGYSTLSNETESTQGYLHGTFDLGPQAQIHADALLAHESDKFSIGLPFATTDALADFPDGVIYDPNVDDYLRFQHLFSPEEVGGVRSTLNSANTNTWRTTLGIAGRAGSSRWTYDLGFTYMEQKLTEEIRQQLTRGVSDYFNGIFGPDLGPDPYGNNVSTRMPDYGTFYSPVTPSQYSTIGTTARSDSRTENGMVRAQLTNAAWFGMPGGAAGIALAAEAGHEEWRYVPDPGYFDGELWSTSAVAGGGDRSRYALTGELRLPVKSWLSIIGSTRFDSYDAGGANSSANTYNVGLELRPTAGWLLRSRIGTAFKAPTLADQFQGLSYTGSNVIDYFQCSQKAPGSDCHDYIYFVSVSTSGNPNLKPIRANISSVGTVWSPTSRASISMDYLHWNIGNETAVLDQDTLTQTESECRNGTLDIQSPTCVAALANVARDSSGNITSLFVPKINIASEVVNAFVAQGRCAVALGEYGELELQAAWSDMLTHSIRPLPGDPATDTLSNYSWGGEFKSRIDASATWSMHQWTSTVYINRLGASPNFAAAQEPQLPGAGSLHPWTITNLTTRYRWSRQLEVSASVQNLFDVMPPPDHTWGGRSTFPYPASKYNVYGMSYFAQLTYQIGR